MLSGLFVENHFCTKMSMAYKKSHTYFIRELLLESEFPQGLFSCCVPWQWRCVCSQGMLSEQAECKVVSPSFDLSHGLGIPRVYHHCTRMGTPASLLFKWLSHNPYCVSVVGNWLFNSLVLACVLGQCGKPMLMKWFILDFLCILGHALVSVWL